MSRTGAAAPVRALVMARARWCCERCGVEILSGEWSIQHRRARGMGGSKRPDTNQPPNLALLCGSGTTGCHGYVESRPAAAMAEGWRVEQGKDPGVYPILWHGREWRLLAPDGTYSEPT